ncbi:MAG: ABC transporter ATP-binding protein/permease [Pseudomonadota bacterium]
MDTQVKPESTETGPLILQVVRRLWPFVWESRQRIAVALLCMMLAKGAVILIPFLLKYLVDALDADAASLSSLALLALVAAYGGARFANVFFGELRDTVFGRVTERAMRRVGLQVFQHLHALDLSFHLNRRTGGLARDMERGISGISFLMRFFIFNIAPTLFEICVVAAILFSQYGVAYASVTVFSVVVYAGFSLRATEWRTQYVREMNEADSESNTRAVDSLMNFETVKYFTNEEFEARRYDLGLARWEQARRRNRLSLFGLNGGQALIIAVAQTCMIGMAATDVRSGVMTLGDFILVNQFMIQLFLPLNFLGFVFREIKGALASIEQLFALLSVKARVVDRPDAKTLQITEGAVAFEQVDFAYSAARPIIQDLSFAIEPGQNVAVVGASGAGKSTLVKLLFRFYDPDRGHIRIDGQDISDVTQLSLREAIGIVPQDTVLFNDSLFENIRYGNPAATDSEVHEAIRLAHLEEFIDHLPDREETLVGERGLKLSGGEKQRVAIARTLLKRPPILVFDEATSSLDSRSERAILAALEEISSGHTSLVIAHRLSTIVDADKILVLEAGRLVEQGDHHSLLAQQGIYAALWQAQQKQYAQNHPH